ncbi:MAG: DUF945 family protein [Gammaproteobacteria bacterium]|nr:DUF945 family protein [Gammaproteobacteria bacterium]
MNKPVLYTAAALIAGVLVYIGSVILIGEQVESAISSIEADMIQSDELIVHRFEYESGFGGGVLSYDLELSSAFDGMAGDLLTELAAVIGELRAEGTLDVTHGPWIGDGMGFAAAGTKLEFPVGDEVRQLLPQYPGSAPAATVYASVELGGSVNLRLETLAYDGRLVMEDESITLTTAGIGAGLMFSGEDVVVGFDISTFKLSDEATEFLLDGMALGLETSDSVSELALSFDLDELSVSDTDSETQLSVQSIGGSGSSRSFLPGIWLGDNDFSIERVSLAVEETAVEALNIRVFGGIDEDSDGLLAASSLLNISELKVAEASVNGIELGVGYENINAEALSDFIQLSEEFNVNSVDVAELLGALLSMVNALSADGPTLTVAPIAISLVESGDTSAAFSVGFSGIAAIEEATAEELFEAMSLSGEFSITADAVRKLIEIGLISSDDTLSAQELESAVDSGYQQLISAIEGSGFVAISDTGLSTRVEVSGGAMRINGEETEAGAELFAAALSQLGDSGAMASDADTSDFPEEALYDNVSLVTGFNPDPYLVSILAGGDSAAAEELGADCVGNVTSMQPDVALNYTAGSSFGLYLYAEAAEDTTLIVLGPDGWYCDDDSHGDLNPGVTFDSPSSGDYLIWVGTYGGGVVDAELGITETLFGDTAGAVTSSSSVDASDFPSDGLFENVSLTTGFTPDPYSVELTAGGDNPASSELGTECTGNVTSSQPDVVLNYTAGSDYGLSLYAESDSDTTLIVLTPSGWRCDDDSYGDLNPNIRLDSPQSGDYLIWIGTYDSGVADAELGFSEY